MRRYRILADLLTELRLVLGVAMIAAAQALQQISLPFLAAAQLISWTTDLLDGPVARRAPAYGPGTIGRHDLAVDVFAATCLLLALVLAGWMDPALAFWYAIAASIALLVTRFARPVAMALQGPVYLWLIVVALYSDAPLWGWLLVGWIGLVVALTWPKFPNEVIPGFLSGMAALGTRSRHIWKTHPWRSAHRSGHR